MILEFFGVPGSGKTTLAQETVERLRKSGRRVAIRPCADPRLLARVKRQPVKALYIARLCVTRPRLFKACLDIITKYTSARGLERWRLVQVFAYLTSLKEFEAPRHEVLVLHQGFLQLAYSIAFGCRNKRSVDLQELLRHMPMSEAYVLTTVPAELVRTRLANRQGTWSSLEVELRSNGSAVEESGSIVEELAVLLSTAGYEPVRVDSTDTASLDKGSQRVVSKVEEYCHAVEIS